MMREICLHLGPEQIAVLTGVLGNSEDDRIGAVRVYRARGSKPPRSAREAVRSIACLGYVVARERPAVLQFASVSDAYLAYWAGKAFRRKYIFYAHGNEVLSAARSPWEKTRTALMGAACVVANSRYTAGLLRQMGLPEGRIRIVHPGCDLDHFHRVEITVEERARFVGRHTPCRVVLTVGNLVERKGHDTVIRALTLLPESCKDVIYLIAGDGPARAALEQLAKSLGIADRVVFLGRVPSADLPKLYSLAEFFVMVSRERAEQCDVEGFGIVFIEAAACGTPAIGGRSGGIEDAIIDRETGLLVDPLDVPGVAREIHALLSRPEQIRRLGDAASQRAIREFGWDRYVASIASILDEVAQG